MDKITCSECGKKFSNEEALSMHTRMKHTKRVKDSSSKVNQKKLKNWAIFIVVAVLFIGGIFYLKSNIKNLPPTDIQGHIEVSPSSHILKEPMSIAVQKHMLEHADGSGPPGVVINYNCKDYSCENGLIENLEKFAKKYNYVYVAPFPDMDAKIALTRYGKIEILDNYDEGIIERFILSG